MSSNRFLTIFQKQNSIFINQIILKIANQYFFGWFTAFSQFTLNSLINGKVEIGGLFMSNPKTMAAQDRISLKIESEIV